MRRTRSLNLVRARALTHLRKLSSAPTQLATAAFRYELPPELIAQDAAEPRDAARLLVSLPGGEVADTSFSQLPSLLKEAKILINFLDFV